GRVGHEALDRDRAGRDDVHLTGLDLAVVQRQHDRPRARAEERPAGLLELDALDTVGGHDRDRRTFEWMSHTNLPRSPRARVKPLAGDDRPASGGRPYDGAPAGVDLAVRLLHVRPADGVDVAV